MGRASVIVEHYKNQKFIKEEELGSDFFINKAPEIGWTPTIKQLFSGNVFYGYDQGKWIPIPSSVVFITLTKQIGDVQPGNGILLFHHEKSKRFWFPSLRVVSKSKPRPPPRLFEDDVLIPLCAVCQNSNEDELTYLDWEDVYVCQDRCYYKLIKSLPPKVTKKCHTCGLADPNFGYIEVQGYYFCDNECANANSITQRSYELEIDYYHDCYHKVTEYYNTEGGIDFPNQELTDNGTYQFCYVSNTNNNWLRVDLSRRSIYRLIRGKSLFGLYYEDDLELKRPIYSFNRMKFITTDQPNGYENPNVIHLIAKATEPALELDWWVNMSVQDPPVITYQDLQQRIIPFYFGSYQVVLEATHHINDVMEIQPNTLLTDLGSWIRFALKPRVKDPSDQIRINDLVNTVYNGGYHRYQIEMRNPYQDTDYIGADPETIEDQMLALAELIELLPPDQLEGITQQILNLSQTSPLQQMAQDWILSQL